MPARLLQTRMSIPPLRPGAVSRPRLIEQVNAGLAGRLTLVTAPAGFGKTTLILEWLDQLPAAGYPWKKTHCAWVSLDPSDNRPEQFFAYLLGALQRMIPGFSADLIASLENAVDTDLMILIQDLLNEFATNEKPFLVVFDDYHVINDEIIHELTNLLVEYLPPNVHIVITARDTPPLDLARWRVRGYLNEILASDLRFKHEEVRSFLSGTMRLDLPDEVIAALETSTEGWVAGLQLASLTFRGQSVRDEGKQPVDWSQRFSGSERTVADYLLTEVLERQEENVQEFLLRTAILPQFNASLCEHLPAVGQVDTDERISAQQMLELLEKSDLFLIPLDNQRRWYRYHHLFAEMLRDRLNKTVSAEEIDSLHLAASEWFESRGMINEAIDQSFEAEAEDNAARLIEAIPKRLLWNPELGSMLPSWRQRLSKSTLADHPGIILNSAAVQLIQGQISDLRLSLEFLKQYRSLQAEYKILEAILLRNNGQLIEAFELLNEAIDRLPDSSNTIRDIAYLQLSVCSMQLGELDEAERFTNIIRSRHEAPSSENSEILPVHLQAIQWHGHLVAIRGDLTRARSICQIGLARIAASGQPSPMSGLLCAQLGDIYYQWNELPTAEDYFGQAMTWGERTRITDILFSALYGLADLACCYRDKESLLDVIEQFRSFYQAAQIPGLEARIDWIAAGYWLRMGDLDKAVRWANAAELPLDVPPPYPIHDGYQTLIAVRIAESRAYKNTKHLREMLTLVEQLIPQAKITENRLQLIRNFLLRALLLDGLSRRKEAVRTLYQAVEMGQPGEYVRVYLDFGSLLLELLQKSLSYGEHVPAIRQLLIAFAKESSHKSPRLSEAELDQESSYSIGDADNYERPIEPLTERENEVLQLLAKGYSNKAIQEQLFISNNTVRTHIKNLYSKLGVSNRTQAVLLAQDLGIV